MADKQVRLTRYKRWLEVNYDSPCTHRSYYTVASAYMLWAMGNTTAERARAWIENMIRNKVKSSTIMQRKHALAAFFTYLEAQKIVPGGSSAKIIKMKVPKCLKRPPVVMPEDVYEKIIAVIEDETDEAQFRLTWDCALRVQELMDLTVEDLDDKPTYLRVKVAKRTDGMEYAWTPVEAETVAAVRKHLRRHNITEGYLFPPPMTDERPKCMMRRLCKKAGVAPAGKKSYNIHSLRHGRAMERYRSSNYNLEFVQKWLRHQSIESTKIYAAMEPEDLRKMADMIAMQRQPRCGEDDDE